MKKLLFIALFSIGTLSFAQLSNHDINKAGLRFIHEQAQAFDKYADIDFSLKNSYSLYDNIEVINLLPSGFVVMAKSTNVTPVLAYSFEDECPEINNNTGFLFFAENYSSQINIAKDFPNPIAINEWERLLSDNYKTTKEPGSGILPILHTKWNQGMYYNSECPEDPAGPAGHVVTGCVATALAQLMNYFRWPLQGENEYGYEHEDYGWLEVNFAEQNYDYDQMAISLTEENFEVAHLMYNIGVSVDMNYGPDGSGMWNHKGAYTLYTYFKYNEATSYLFRDSLPQDFDWAGMLIDHLDQKIPLYYAGWSDYEFIMGHAFIVDGYQDSTFFHFNWGWGGSSDGYFNIDNLTPGGSDFTLLHEAIAYALPEGDYPYGCNGIKTLNTYSGTISDGSGPLNPYQNNMSCDWLIEPQDSASGFEIEFLELELDDNDLITIFDGPEDTFPVIDSYTGNTLPELIETSADKVLIRFETNSDSVAGGFLLSYKGIKPDYCSLINNISEPEGTITDGSNSYQYQNNTFCNWVIQPENAESITVTFTEFDTEPVNDYVKLINSSDQTVANLSGSDIPEPITIPGNKITITFRSNPNTRGGGFSLDYETQFVGIEDITQSTYKIFPNPADGFINLKLNGSGKISVNIMDATGRLVLKESFNNQSVIKIAVNSLETGNYILYIPELAISKKLMILR
jgi:hypothetical protein